LAHSRAFRGVHEGKSSTLRYQFAALHTGTKAERLEAPSHSGPLTRSRVHWSIPREVDLEVAVAEVGAQEGRRSGPFKGPRLERDVPPPKSEEVVVAPLAPVPRAIHASNSLAEDSVLGEVVAVVKNDVLGPIAQTLDRSVPRFPG